MYRVVDDRSLGIKPHLSSWYRGVLREADEHHFPIKLLMRVQRRLPNSHGTFIYFTCEQPISNIERAVAYLEWKQVRYNKYATPPRAWASTYMPGSLEALFLATQDMINREELNSPEIRALNNNIFINARSYTPWYIINANE